MVPTNILKKKVLKRADFYETFRKFAPKSNEMIKPELFMEIIYAYGVT